MTVNNRTTISKLYVLSAVFGATFLGYVVLSYNLHPYQFRSGGLIVFGITWQLIGTFIIAKDALRPDWFRNFQDFFHEFASGKFLFYLISLRDIKLLDSLRLPNGIWRKTRVMLLAMLAASLMGLTILCVFLSAPFFKALIVVLLTCVGVLIVYGFVVLATWKFPHNVLLLILLPLYYVVCLPLILLFMTLIIGPFAIGEIIVEKIKPVRANVMLGLTYILIGLIAELLIVIVPTIGAGGIPYEQGLGRPIVAGNAWYEVYSPDMSHGEKAYYERWRNIMKDASDAMVGVVGMVPADENQHMEEAIDARGKLSRIRGDLFGLEPPPVFLSLHDSSQNDLATLSNEVEDFIEGSNDADAISKAVRYIGKHLENEIKRSFVVISNR